MPGRWWQNLREGRRGTQGPAEGTRTKKEAWEGQMERTRTEVRELMAEREERIQKNLKEKSEGERKDMRQKD